MAEATVSARTRWRVVNRSANARDQAQLVRLTERLSERRGVAEVARRERDPVRRLPSELLEKLEDDRLLSLDAERIDRVCQIDSEPVGGLAHETQAVVEVPTDQQRAGAVGDRLRQLA